MQEEFEQLFEDLVTFISARTAEINQLKTDNAEALAELSQLSQRVYDYEHTDFAVKSLEEAYDGIMESCVKTSDTQIYEGKTYYTESEEDGEKVYTEVSEPDAEELDIYYVIGEEEFSELSAVGFTALLKDGDKIKINGSRLFINGTEETSDYTFTGENGNEYVNVWYFENGGSLNLSEDVDILITELDIRAIQTVPTISSTYYDFVQNIKTYKFTLPSAPVSCKNVTENGEYTKATASVSGNTRTYSSDAVHIKSSIPSFTNKTSIEYLDFPNLKYFGGNTLSDFTSGTNGSNYLNGFYGMTNPNLRINFPALEYIIGGMDGNSIPFYGHKTVEIPGLVKKIFNRICRENGTIKLYCKDAEAVSDNWCYSAPTALFYMCDDWGASINIATAAANWQKDDFLDLFNNKLRDMEDDVREIKIPTAIYDSLTDEEFALAEDKGWTVGC